MSRRWGQLWLQRPQFAAGHTTGPESFACARVGARLRLRRHRCPHHAGCRRDLVRRASARVANKPHHRTISTAAPGRRSRGAIRSLNAHEVVHVSVSTHFWMDGGCGEGRATISLGSRPYRAARCEMSSEPQEIGSGKTLAARSQEVDFAVVLCRVIESVEHDPAQLRNAVYELARIKLQREASRKNSPINPLEERRLTLALESAIEGVETIYSKHDDLRAPWSLHRLTESSEIGRSKIMIESRAPLLMIDEPQSRAQYRAKDTSPNVQWSLHWPGAAPLLR